MKITKEMVVQQILKNFQKNRVHIKKNGKEIIPQSVDDLQPRIIKRTINKKNNKHYDKAYSQLYYKLVKGPKDKEKTAKINNKLKASSRTNIVAMPEVGPTYPSIRTGRVNAKKPFIARYDNGTVITVHPDTGLITADFKL